MLVVAFVVFLACDLMLIVRRGLLAALAFNLFLVGCWLLGDVLGLH